MVRELLEDYPEPEGDQCIVQVSIECSVLSLFVRRLLRAEGWRDADKEREKRSKEGTEGRTQSISKVVRERLVLCCVSCKVASLSYVCVCVWIE